MTELGSPDRRAPPSDAPPVSERLLERLVEAVGAEGVVTDAIERSYRAQDVFTEGLPAGVVVHPGDIDALVRAVRAATEAGAAVVPRGGGMSYSSGYVPAEAGSVLIDLSRMNRVLEINREDMHVTVECGITWERLAAALAGSGLRTPYWGTLSGLLATVGGGLSQNSVFWGSGQHGSAADSVLSLRVALADGSLLATGSAAQRRATPFFRHYGPDLTGLFTCDCGAFGVKAHASLRLIPDAPAARYASVAFEGPSGMLRAMSEIARRGLVSECFGFDPFLQRQRMRRDSVMRDAKRFASALRRTGSWREALEKGAGMALAGRGFMDEVAWSFHMIAEGRREAAVDLDIAEAVDVARAHGGEVLADSIPRLARANPFGPLNNMVGPDGERWAPVHGLVPHSSAEPALEAVEAFFRSERETMERFGVRTGYLLATVSTHCFVVEPVFFWPDALTEIHRRSLTPDFLARLSGFPESLAAREAVARLRAGAVDALQAHGAVHLQVAKSYPYRESLRAENWRVLEALKSALDPRGRMNPKALGL